MVGPHHAIVIAGSQHRRQSLAALLRSMPEFGKIYEAESIALLDPPEFFYPNLVVFDCWQGEEISQEMLDMVRGRFPEIRCLALTRQNNPSAENTDINAALVEGFTIDLFFDTVRQLLKINGSMHL
jgi:hypothetical protein